ncbi:MAG: helix-turn-helix domain-containing protein [Acidobacteriaceae bacterium]|nr:helix-turn-helix domain-containing protein [Acidobacteriaceae bacterium]
MAICSRLQEIRKGRGISAAELARRVGVSRQTIYSIEDGTFLPNTATSLELARALDVTVEEIFSIREEPSQPRIIADLLSGDQEAEGQFVRACRVNQRVTAVSIPFLPAYLPLADGIIQSRTRRRVSIKPAVPLREQGKSFLIAGCDPALSLLRESLQSSGIEIITASCSSRRALEWLKQGRVHAAGSHLLDRHTGDYNLPVIRRLLPKKHVRVVNFANWEQGLVLRRGNPKSIRSIADLARKNVRFVNRERGSGSRDLLDTGLRRVGIRSNQVRGYDFIVHGHLAAAYAVACGTADCCIATRSASRCFGLDFIALRAERFDLAFTQASLELPAAKALLDSLNRSQLRKKLQCIAGYDTTHTGDLVM